MIGIDIVFIPKFKRMLESRYGSKLLSRIYNQDELQQCMDKSRESRLECLAGRFAVKEAVIKASKGELNITDLKYIEIKQDSSGFIDVFITKKNVHCKKYDVSLSHDGKYAIGIAAKALE